MLGIRRIYQKFHKEREARLMDEYGLRYKLRNVAYYDELTGLSNRSFLVKEVKKLIEDGLPFTLPIHSLNKYLFKESESA